MCNGDMKNMLQQEELFVNQTRTCKCYVEEKTPLTIGLHFAGSRFLLVSH